VENIIMATDGGATVNPPAMEMLTAFIREMLDAGISEEEVEMMIKENPRRVLSIE
jgi:predicted metal-dependent phosphotriesterase family hydrolase